MPSLSNNLDGMFDLSQDVEDVSSSPATPHRDVPVTSSATHPLPLGDVSNMDLERRQLFVNVIPHPSKLPAWSAHFPKQGMNAYVRVSIISHKLFFYLSYNEQCKV